VVGRLVPCRDLGRAKEELAKLQEAFPKDAQSDPYCRLLAAQLQLLKLPSCKGKDKEKQLQELNQRLNKVGAVLINLRAPAA
jgi:hypothetical protein